MLPFYVTDQRGMASRHGGMAGESFFFHTRYTKLSAHGARTEPHGTRRDHLRDAHVRRPDPFFHSSGDVGRVLAQSRHLPRFPCGTPSRGRVRAQMLRRHIRYNAARGRCTRRGRGMRLAAHSRTPVETWPRGALLPGIRRRRLVVIAPGTKGALCAKGASCTKGAYQRCSRCVPKVRRVLLVPRVVTHGKSVFPLSPSHRGGGPTERQW